LNEVGFFVFVVTSEDGLSEDEMTTNPGVYKYFILVPTRTPDGEINIRYDDPFAQNFFFYFNRETRVMTKPGMLKVPDHIVLVAGEPLPENLKERLTEWDARKKVDMVALNTRYDETLRDKEQDKRRENAAKKRRRNQGFESD
jgi:hypothetical protein